MNAKTHGKISIVLIVTAQIIAFAYGFTIRPGLSLVALLIWASAIVMILGNFCKHCTGCEKGCAHHWPGKMTHKIFGCVPIERYSNTQLASTAIGAGVMMIMPAVVLWGHGYGVLAYAAVLGIGVAEITTKVCPACCNRICPLNSKTV